MEGANLFRKERNIDIVFCMDGTGSMAPCIENVKKNALRFYADFARAMTDMGGDIGMMRVRAIVFRDYKCDGEEAMQQSAFFELPEEAAAFEKFLAGVRAHGGCGEDANGLEALYYAMRSDFTTGGERPPDHRPFRGHDGAQSRAQAQISRLPRRHGGRGRTARDVDVHAGASLPPARAVQAPRDVCARGDGVRKEDLPRVQSQRVRARADEPRAGRDRFQRRRQDPGGIRERGVLRGAALRGGG